MQAPDQDFLHLLEKPRKKHLPRFRMQAPHEEFPHPVKKPPRPVCRTWYRLELSFAGTAVSARINGVPVASLDIRGYHSRPAGMVALGSGWHAAQFDNFTVS